MDDDHLIIFCVFKTLVVRVVGSSVAVKTPFQRRERQQLDIGLLKSEVSYVVFFFLGIQPDLAITDL